MTIAKNYFSSIDNDELEHATGIDTSDLATKKFVTLKAEFDKLHINKLNNVATSLNNL